MSSCPALYSAFTCSSEVSDLSGFAGRLQGVEGLAQHRDGQGEAVVVAELDQDHAVVGRQEDDVVVAQYGQGIDLALPQTVGGDDGIAGVVTEEPDGVFQAVDAAVGAPWRQLEGDGEWPSVGVQRAADVVVDVGVVDAHAQRLQLAIDGALEFAAAIAAEIGEFVQGDSLLRCKGKFGVQLQGSGTPAVQNCRSQNAPAPLKISATPAMPAISASRRP
jgi:hypothetical protein